MTHHADDDHSIPATPSHWDESSAADRETAVLDAWLNGEELPEGTLARELPWLRDLFWEMTAKDPKRRSTRAWKMYREQALRQVGGRTGPCLRMDFKSQTLALAGEDEEGPFDLPPDTYWGLTNNLQAVKIEYPVQPNAVPLFPTHLALIEWKSGDTVTRALLKVQKRKQHYWGFSTLSDLFPHLSRSQLRQGELFATSVSFHPEVLFRVDREQLSALVMESPEDAVLREVQRRCDDLDRSENNEG